jgi:hypothetical protein
VLKSFARACCQAGLHLLLIEPYGKRPVDVRSSVQRRNDDGAAQDAARAAGRPDWDKVKSKGGVYLATNDETLICRYIDRYRKLYESDYDDTCPVNFGVAVGPSKLIVVDCDTREQLEAFLRDSAEAAGVEANLDIPPTVKSPGQQDETGHWAHSEGGHFYFTVEHPLPDFSGSMTAPGGYAILWANRYVLIPPSVRQEGAYRLTGQDYPAPDWLRAKISDAVTAKVARSQDSESSAELTTVVDAWAKTVEWEDLLAPYGWVPTARPDNCGCDVWTAPGDHASPKSATAHDTGCSLGRYTCENAPLHIWTDNPGPELEAWIASHGTKTLSRLQVVAALEYGGNVGEAMRGLQVMPDDSGVLGFGSDLARDLGISPANLDAPIPIPASPEPSLSGDADPFAIAGSVAREIEEKGEEQALKDEEEDKPLRGVPEIMPFSHWRDMPPPEFVIEGLLEHRGFTAMVGAPGVGKSGVVLDMAAAICTGRRWMGRKTMRQPVLYLPGEGLSGAVQRLRAWESAHDVDLGDDLFIGDSIIQVAASPEAWSAVIMRMLEFRIGMLIIDTFARASVGLEENSASDVGRAIAKFDQVRQATGAGLMVVHHSAKHGGSRGSSALNGALDTELLIQEGSWWDRDTNGICPGRALDLWVTKQKNAAMPETALPMIALPFGESFVMTGPSGIVDDPLDVVSAPRAIIPETVVSIAIRLQELAERFTVQGLTRSDFAQGCPMDDSTAQRRDAKTAWKLRVGEAVDLGLRYGLLQTLTGTATGARYIPDACTPDQARQRWADENMGVQSSNP